MKQYKILFTLTFLCCLLWSSGVLAQPADGNAGAVFTCPGGGLLDCDGECAPANWLGDTFCDDGSFTSGQYGFPVDFDCPALHNDVSGTNDDCGLGAPPCPVWTSPFLEYIEYDDFGGVGCGLVQDGALLIVGVAGGGYAGSVWLPAGSGQAAALAAWEAAGGGMGDGLALPTFSGTCDYALYESYTFYALDTADMACADGINSAGTPYMVNTDVDYAYVPPDPAQFTFTITPGDCDGPPTIVSDGTCPLDFVPTINTTWVQDLTGCPATATASWDYEWQVYLDIQFLTHGASGTATDCNLILDGATDGVNDVGAAVACTPVTNYCGAPVIGAIDPCSCANGIDLDAIGYAGPLVISGDAQIDLAQEVITFMGGSGNYTLTTVTGLYDATGAPIAGPIVLPPGTNTFTAYVPADAAATYTVDFEDSNDNTNTGNIGGGPCPACAIPCDCGSDLDVDIQVDVTVDFFTFGDFSFDQFITGEGGDPDPTIIWDGNCQQLSVADGVAVDGNVFGAGQTVTFNFDDVVCSADCADVAAAAPVTGMVNWEAWEEDGFPVTGCDDGLTCNQFSQGCATTNDDDHSTGVQTVSFSYTATGVSGTTSYQVTEAIPSSDGGTAFITYTVDVIESVCNNTGTPCAGGAAAICNLDVKGMDFICNTDGSYSVSVDYILNGPPPGANTYAFTDAAGGTGTALTNSGDDPNTSSSGTMIFGTYAQNAPHTINIFGGNCDLTLDGASPNPYCGEIGGPDLTTSGACATLDVADIRIVCDPGDATYTAYVSYVASPTGNGLVVNNLGAGTIDLTNGDPDVNANGVIAVTGVPSPGAFSIQISDGSAACDIMISQNLTPGCGEVGGPPSGDLNACADAQDINLDSKFICEGGTLNLDIVVEGDVVFPDENGDGTAFYLIHILNTAGIDPYNATGIGVLEDRYDIPVPNVTNFDAGPTAIPTDTRSLLNAGGLGFLVPRNELLYAVGSVWDDDGAGSFAPPTTPNCQDATSYQPFILLDGIDAVNGHCRCRGNGTDGTDAESDVVITFNGGGIPQAFETAGQPGNQDLLDFLNNHGMTNQYSFQLSGAEVAAVTPGITSSVAATSGTAIIGAELLITTVDGQPWEVTITDGAGCERVITGVCDQPDPDFTALNSIYCVDDPPNTLFDEAIFEVGFENIGSNVNYPLNTPVGPLTSDAGADPVFGFGVQSYTFSTCPGPYVDAVCGTQDIIDYLLSFTINFNSAGTYDADFDGTPAGNLPDIPIVFIDFGEGSGPILFVDDPVAASLFGFAQPDDFTALTEDLLENTFGFNNLATDQCLTITVYSFAETFFLFGGPPGSVVDPNWTADISGSVSAPDINCAGGTLVGTFHFDGSPVTGGVPGVDPMVDFQNGTATFDPFFAGPGQHLVSYCIEYGASRGRGQSPGYFDAENDACAAIALAGLISPYDPRIYPVPSPTATNPNFNAALYSDYQACNSRCEVCADQVFSVYPVFDPVFTLPTQICVGSGPIEIQLTNITPILSLLQQLEPTFDPDNTVDEEDFFITWTGPGMFDMNDGAYSGTPGALGTADDPDVDPTQPTPNPTGDGSGSALFYPNYTGTGGPVGTGPGMAIPLGTDGTQTYTVGPGGTFSTGTPSANTGVGIYTVCVEVGYPNCAQEFCQTIEVVEQLNATINNATVCAGSTGQFDLTSMFTNGVTDLGGTFTGVVTSNNNAAANISGDILTYDPNAISNPMTVDVTYTIGTPIDADGDGDIDGDDEAPGCFAIGTATLTLVPVPSDDLDLPSSICDDQPVDFSVYLVDSQGNPSTMTGTYSIVTSGSPTGADSIDPTTGVYTPEVTTSSYNVTIQFEGINVSGTDTCNVIDQEVIEVKHTGNPAWTNPGPVCADGNFATTIWNPTLYVDGLGWPLDTLITGDPGGTWSGAYVSFDAATMMWYFNPPLLTDDGAVVTYCVGFEECERCLTQTIDVSPCLQADINQPADSTYCLEGLPDLPCLDLDRYLSTNTDEGGTWAFVHNNLNGLESTVQVDANGNAVLVVGGDDVAFTDTSFPGVLSGTYICFDELYNDLAPNGPLPLPLTDIYGSSYADFTVFYIQPQSGVCLKHDTFGITVKDQEECRFEMPSVVCETNATINLNDLLSCNCDAITVTEKLSLSSVAPDQLVAPISFNGIPDGSKILEVIIAYDYVGTTPDSEGDLTGFTITNPDGTTLLTHLTDAVDCNDANGNPTNDDDNYFGDVCSTYGVPNPGYNTADAGTCRGDQSNFTYTFGVDTLANGAVGNLNSLTNGCFGLPFTYALTSNSGNFAINLYVQIRYTTCLFGPLTLHEVNDAGGTVPPAIQMELDNFLTCDAQGQFFLNTQGLGEYDELDIPFKKLSCNGCDVDTTATFVVLEEYDATLNCNGGFCASDSDPIYLPDAFFLSGVTTPGGVWTLAGDTLHPVDSDAISGDVFYPENVAAGTYDICYVMQEGFGPACGIGAAVSCCQIMVPEYCTLEFAETTTCETCEEGVGIELVFDTLCIDFNAFAVTGGACRSGIDSLPDVIGGPTKPTSEDDPNAVMICGDFYTVIPASVTGIPVGATVDSVTFNYNYYSTLGTAQGDHDGWGIYMSDPSNATGCIADGNGFLNYPSGAIIGQPDNTDPDGDNHFPGPFMNGTAGTEDSTITSGSFIDDLNAMISAASWNCDDSIAFWYIVASNSQYWDACFNIEIHLSNVNTGFQAVLHETGTPLVDLLGYDPIFAGDSGKYYINTCQLGQFDEIDVIFTDACNGAGTCVANIATSTPLVVLEEEAAPEISGLPGVVCEGTGTLTGFAGLPAGGTWSISTTGIDSLVSISPATGISYTSVAGDVITVTYTGPASNSGICDNGANNTVQWLITVIDSDDDFAPTISGDAVACINNDVVLTGSPSGGTWTLADGSTSTDATVTVTSATVGDVTVTYTVDVNGNCASGPVSSSFTVSFLDSDPATPLINGIPAVICADDSQTFNLGDHIDTPGDNGSWTVNGTDAGTPPTYTSSTTAGATDVITYTATVADICAPGGSATVTVEWLVSIIGDDGFTPEISGDAVSCINDGPVALTAWPANGTWSDNVTVDDDGNATIAPPATPSDVTVSYTAPSAGSCGSGDVTTEFVVSFVTSTPGAYALNLPSTVCVDAASITLGSDDISPTDANYDNATWTITFNDGDAITTVAGPELTFDQVGFYDITYETVVADVCGGADIPLVLTHEIAVVDEDPVTPVISGVPAIVCESGGPYDLSANPADGTWSGDGVDPDAGTYTPTGVGQDEITYTVTYDDPCLGPNQMASVTWVVEVVEDGNFDDILPDNVVCQSTDDFSIDLTQYLNTGAVSNGGTFQVANLRPFINEIEYSNVNESNLCTNKDLGDPGTKDDTIIYRDYVEIAGQAGTDLADYFVVLYDAHSHAIDNIGEGNGRVYAVLSPALGYGWYVPYSDSRVTPNQWCNSPDDLLFDDTDPRIYEDPDVFPIALIGGEAGDPTVIDGEHTANNGQDYGAVAIMLGCDGDIKAGPAGIALVHIGDMDDYSTPQGGLGVCGANYEVVQFIGYGDANTDPDNPIANGDADNDYFDGINEDGCYHVQRDVDEDPDPDFDPNPDDFDTNYGFSNGLNTNKGIFAACNGPAATLTTTDINVVDELFPGGNPFEERSLQFTNGCWQIPDITDPATNYPRLNVPPVDYPNDFGSTACNQDDLNNNGQFDDVLRSIEYATPGHLNWGQLAPGMTGWSGCDNSSAEEFYFDFIAPNGDILNLANFCPTLFVGGLVAEEDETYTYGPLGSDGDEDGALDGDGEGDNILFDFRKNQVYPLTFSYGAVGGLCNGDDGLVTVYILEHYEEWWEAPAFLCEESCDVNLNTLFMDSIQFIPPDFVLTFDEEFEVERECQENIAAPFITEIHYAWYDTLGGFNGPARDQHCVKYNYIDQNDTPFDMSDDTYETEYFCDGIEISGLTGQDLSCYSLLFYTPQVFGLPSGFNVSDSTSACPSQLPSFQQGLLVDVTYIDENGLPKTTNVASGEYMELYGVIDDDTKGQAYNRMLSCQDILDPGTNNTTLDPNDNIYWGYNPNDGSVIPLDETLFYLTCLNPDNDFNTALAYEIISVPDFNYGTPSNNPFPAHSPFYGTIPNYNGPCGTIFDPVDINADCAPGSLDPDGSIPAIPGLYLDLDKSGLVNTGDVLIFTDTNGNGAYDAGEELPDGLDECDDDLANVFPWEQIRIQDNCPDCFTPNADHDSAIDEVGARWFPMLDVPNNSEYGVAVGLFNHCNGETFELLAYNGLPLCINNPSDFSLAGPFHQQTATVIDTVQNAENNGGDLRGLQLMSCSCAAFSTCCQCDRTGTQYANAGGIYGMNLDGGTVGQQVFWGLIYNNGAGSQPNNGGAGAGGVEPACGEDEHTYSYSNSFGYYNCGLDPRIPLQRESCVLSLTINDEDLPDNYVITSHELKATVSGGFAYTWTLGDSIDGGRGCILSENPEIACSANGCGTSTSGTVNCFPGFPFPDGSEVDVVMNGNELCDFAFEGYCSKTAERTYYLDISGAVNGVNVYDLGDEMPFYCPGSLCGGAEGENLTLTGDTCLLALGEVETFEVSLSVRVKGVQCFPVGSFYGQGVSLNTDNWDDPYWTLDPSGLCDFSPLQVTYDAFNPNELDADEDTDDIRCVDPSSEHERTQLIPIVCAEPADFSVDTLEICINTAPFNMGQYLNNDPANPSVMGAFTQISGGGLSGTIFDPAAAGVGTHVVQNKVGGSSQCADSDQLVIVVDGNPEWDWSDDIMIGNNVAAVCDDAGTYPLVEYDEDYNVIGGISNFFGNSPINTDISVSECVSGSIVDTAAVDYLISKDTAFVIVPDIPCGAEVVRVDVGYTYQNTDGGFGDADEWTLIAPDGTIVDSGSNDNAINGSLTYNPDTMAVAPSGQWMFIVESNSFPWEGCLTIDVAYVEGDFAGLGVEYLGDGVWNFNPDGLEDFNSVEVTYSLGCGNCPSVSQDIFVIDGSNEPAVIGDIPTEICKHDDAVTLSATPAGGTWSGPGVTGNVFNPVGLSGDITITYTVGAGDIICSSSASAVIHVKSGGNFFPPSPVCVGASYNIAATLEVGSDPTGTWSASAGTITEDGIFTADAAGVAQITYTVGGCSVTHPVMARGSFNPDWTTEDSRFTYCENEMPVELTKPDGSKWTADELGDWHVFFGTDGADSLITVEVDYTAVIDTVITETPIDTTYVINGAGDTLSVNIITESDTTIVSDSTGVATVWFGADFDLGPWDHVAYSVTHSGGSADCDVEQTATINVYAKPHKPVVTPIEQVLCEGDIADIIQISTGAVEPYPNATFHVFDANGELLQGSLDDLEFNEDIFDPNPYLTDADSTYTFWITEVRFEVWDEICDSDPVEVTIRVNAAATFSYEVGCTDADGTAAIEITADRDDYGPYAVSINGSDFFDFIPGESLNVLTVGANEVSIVDVNGCTSTEIIIVEPQVDFDYTSTCPDADGNVTITAVPSGGEGDYSVSTDGGLSYGDVGEFTVVVNANDSDQVLVRVKDGKGCESEIQLISLNDPISFSLEQSCADADGIVTVTVNPPADASQTITVTNPDGSVTTETVDGTVYTVIVNGNAQEPGDYDFTAPAGATVTVILSAEGCESEPQALTLDTPVSLNVDLACPEFNPDTDASTTEVTFSAAGGSGIYSIVINGTALPFGQVSTTLAPGSYTVFAIDDEGCASATQNIDIADMLTVTLDKPASDLLVCGDEPNRVIVTGPTPESTYQVFLDPMGEIPAPATVNGNEITTSMSCANVIYVVGTTGAGCPTAPLAVSLYNFDAFDAVIDIDDSTCGEGTYTVTATFSGGRPACDGSSYYVDGVAIEGNVFSATIPAGEGYSFIFDDNIDTAPSCQAIESSGNSPCSQCFADAGTLGGLSTDLFCASSVVEGEAVGFSTAANHVQAYVVTDTDQNIVQLSSDGTFSGLADGDYLMWSLNFLQGDATIPGVGENASGLAGCFDLDGPAAFSVLKPITIEAAVNCDAGADGYTVTLTISGGRPEFDGFGSYDLNWQIVGDGNSIIFPSGVGEIDETFAPGDTVSVSVNSDGALCTGGPLLVAIPDAPCGNLIAQDDQESTMIGETVSFNVTNNDAGLDIRVVSVTDPQNGTIVWNPDGTFTYTPDPGFTGIEVIVYQITDANGMMATATVLITVMGDSSELNVTHNRVCDSDDETAMVFVTVSGGVAPYSVSGDVSIEGLGEGESFSYELPAEDQTSYFLVVEDDAGEQAIVDVTGLTPCTKVATELVEFVGEVLSNGNELKWVTASETNNDFFTLEHSVDGVNFTAITTVKGAGTTATPSAYNFLHKDAPAGLSYYRLSDTDFDGVTTALSTITLVRGETGFGFVNVRPVPATVSINVTFTASLNTQVDMKVYDMQGKVVANQTVDANVGANTATLDVSSYAAGSYFITITDGVDMHTTKFLKADK